MSFSVKFPYIQKKSSFCLERLELNLKNYRKVLITKIIFKKLTEISNQKKNSPKIPEKSFIKRHNIFLGKNILIGNKLFVDNKNQIKREINEKRDMNLRLKLKVI